MSNIGVLIEMDEQGIKATNYGVLTAACAGGTVVALVFAENAENFKIDLSRYGAEKIVTMPAGSPVQNAHRMAAAVKKFELNALLGLSSSRGRDLLARCACQMDAPLVLDAIQVNLAEGTAVKSHFSGKTLATMKLQGSPLFIGLRPNVIEAVEKNVTGEVIPFAPDAGSDDGFKVLEVKKSGAGAVGFDRGGNHHYRWAAHGFGR